MSFSFHLAFALLSVLHISDVLSADISSAKDFYVGNKQVTHSTALRKCNARYMKLVGIESPEKEKQITELLQHHGINTSTSLWTSGQSDDDIWIWPNGDEITNFSWGPGEPNVAGDTDKCIAVSLKNGTQFWDDRLCGEKRGYICEKLTTEDLMNNNKNPVYIPTKQFVIIKKEATYYEAIEECEKKNMRLVIIDNAEENGDLEDLIEADSKGKIRAYWTAGQSTKKQRGYSYIQVWKWFSVTPIKYFNWRKGEPNNNAVYNDPCIEVSIKGEGLKWNDDNCSSKRRFVCQKK